VAALLVTRVPVPPAGRDGSLQNLEHAIVINVSLDVST